MLKKSISVFLCTVMVLTSLSLGAFAYHVENMRETLDLSAYSWDDIADKSKWDAAAYATTRNAVRYSVQLLYKLSVEAGIPLVK